MIYVITGENIVDSRNKLLSLLSPNSEIARFDGKKQSLQVILDSLVSVSLFTAKRIVVVEYATKVKPSKELIENIKTFLKDQDTTIILWDEQQLDKNSTNELKTATFFSFEFPKVFFEFIDSFSPKNKKRSLELFKTLSKNTEVEQILYSLIKRVRNLMVVKGNLENEFSETSKMAPWQLEKLKRQALLWRENELRHVFLSLANLDEQIKTSGMTMPLASYLDIILLQDLN